MFSLVYEQAGSHTYTVREKNEANPNITYDETVYTAMVEVTDQNSQLEAACQLERNGEAVEAITFNNHHTPSAIDVPLSATKVLQNRTLAKDEFSFLLKQGGTVRQHWRICSARRRLTKKRKSIPTDSHWVRCLCWRSWRKSVKSSISKTFRQRLYKNMQDCL